MLKKLRMRRKISSIPKSNMLIHASKNKRPNSSIILDRPDTQTRSNLQDTANTADRADMADRADRAGRADVADRTRSDIPNIIQVLPVNPSQIFVPDQISQLESGDHQDRLSILDIESNVSEAGNKCTISNFLRPKLCCTIIMIIDKVQKMILSVCRALEFSPAQANQALTERLVRELAPV